MGVIVEHNVLWDGPAYSGSLSLNHGPSVKKTDAALRISLARRSSRFSRSSVVSPARPPESTSVAQPRPQRIGRHAALHRSRGDRRPLRRIVTVAIPAPSIPPVLVPLGDSCQVLSVPILSRNGVPNFPGAVQCCSASTLSSDRTHPICIGDGQLVSSYSSNMPRPTFNSIGHW